MKLSVAVSILSFLTGINALPSSQQPPRFNIKATSEGPVQGFVLATSSSFFWLGEGEVGKYDGLTETVCPEDVQKKGDCPPGVDTVLKNANTLDSVKPDQHIFVDANFAVRATGPNNVTDAESLADGFKYVAGANGKGEWTYQALGGDGFLACPYNNNIYQVYINSPDAKPSRGKLGDCVPFFADAYEYQLPADATASAWEY
ncbi:hypothetical protein BDW62DRAFT_196651 [Aspergillus aurantiobrunneus]